jgi:hypothetical protein
LGGKSDELSGFQLALRHIDELHGTEFAEGLKELESYTSSIQLAERQLLFEKDGEGGVVKENKHGLFFIEAGIVRVEQDRSDMTLTRTRSYLGTAAMNKLSRNNADVQHTLKGQHARLGTFARQMALAKRRATNSHPPPNLRTARMGPGW